MVFNGRYTGQIDGDFVVFLIGARINSLWRIYKFGFIASAFARMLNTLESNPQKGYLGGEAFFNLASRTTINVTYWRSYDDLERFAHDRNDPHLPAWRDFNRIVGSSGMFGIWHETYLVRANEYEVMYGNMPRFGLAKAARHLRIERGNQQAARGRLTGEAVMPYVEPPEN